MRSRLGGSPLRQMCLVSRVVTSTRKPRHTSNMGWGKEKRKTQEHKKHKNTALGFQPSLGLDFHISGGTQGKKSWLPACFGRLSRTKVCDGSPLDGPHSSRRTLLCRTIGHISLNSSETTHTIVPTTLSRRLRA